jgi:Ca2+-binding EF-hand superfamily protein
MKTLSRTFFEAVLATTVMLSLALLPLAVEAQPKQPPFDLMDIDGDGFVSETELATFHAERMAQRAAEGKPMRNAGNMPAFSDIDADGDGKISREELNAMHAQRQAEMQAKQKGGGQKGARNMASFEDIDLNGDGCISREELDTHHQNRQSNASKR